MTELLQRTLPGVQKPARYTGGEYNEIKKEESIYLLEEQIEKNN